MLPAKPPVANTTDLQSIVNSPSSFFAVTDATLPASSRLIFVASVFVNTGMFKGCYSNKLT